MVNSVATVTRFILSTLTTPVIRTVVKHHIYTAEITDTQKAVNCLLFITAKNKVLFYFIFIRLIAVISGVTNEIHKRKFAKI